MIINPGEMVVINDPEHNRSVEIELDEFDSIYRVMIKHDPEDRSRWYHFEFQSENRLARFLKNKGLTLD